jgi:sarcosine oxidase delta subunit
MSDLIYSLCPDCEHCPTVEFTSDGTVSIGEAPNLVSLRAAEWNELVRAVKSGALPELG